MYSFTWCWNDVCFIFYFVIWSYCYKCKAPSLGKPMIGEINKLCSKSSREDMCRLPISFLLDIQSRVKNRKWTCRRFKTALHDTVLHTDALCQISGSWPVWFPRKMWQKFFVTPTKTTQDDARWQKWSLYVASAKAGRRHNKYTYIIMLFHSLYFKRKLLFTRINVHDTVKILIKI